MKITIHYEYVTIKKIIVIIYLDRRSLDKYLHVHVPTTQKKPGSLNVAEWFQDEFVELNMEFSSHISKKDVQ